MKHLLFLFSAAAALMLGACVSSSSSSYHVTAYAPKNPAAVRVKLSTGTQNIYVMEGNRLLMAVQGTVGAHGTTPLGEFHIISKDKRKRRVSEPDAGYPMAYWCEFKPAYGFHEGFVWNVPHSHGCVRLHREAAARLFALVQVGTPVTIASSLPEDKTYGGQVLKLDQRNDPDPPRAFLLSTAWFRDPAGPLLIQQ